MTKRKRRLNAKIKAASTAAARQGLNTSTHPDAAGIDIGAEELVAAVPAGRCRCATSCAIARKSSPKPDATPSSCKKCSPK